MADVRVTQLPTLALPDDTDVLHAVDVSADKDSQLTIAALKATLPAAPTWATLSGKPTLSAVATSGNYADLTGKPTIPPAATWAALPDKPALAAVATSGSYNDLTDKPASTGGGTAYTLPPATAGTLGGVKIGSGIFVSGDGTISAAAQTGTGTDLAYDTATRVLTSSTGADATLPLAGATTAGMVKRGTGLSWGADGTLSIGLFTTAVAGLAPASGGGTVNFLRADGTWTAPTASISIASASTLGGVKIGSGISVSNDGTISAAAQAGTGTDLAYDPATRLLSSSSGADVTLPEATDQVAGLMSTVQVDNLGAALLRTDLLQENINNLFDTTPMPWAASPGAYTAGSVVSNGGKFYVAARDAVAADVPGTSNKWRDLTLEAIEEKAHNAFTHRVPDWGAATSGQVLTVVTAGTDPTWETPAAGGLPDFTTLAALP